MAKRGDLASKIGSCNDGVRSRISRGCTVSASVKDSQVGLRHNTGSVSAVPILLSVSQKGIPSLGSAIVMYPDGTRS